MIKHILCLLLVLSTFDVCAQDTLKIKKIDLIVKEIQGSNYQTLIDTVRFENPESGLKITNYLTMVLDSKQLKKYENYAHSLVKENGRIKEMITSSTFYYNQDQLIKVEEYAVLNGEKQTMDWYFENGQALYYTLKTDQAEARALLLLNLSKTFLQQVIKQ